MNFSPNGSIRLSLLNRTSFLLPQGTLPWQLILGKIGELTFI